MKNLKFKSVLLLITVLFIPSCMFDNSENANDLAFQIDVRSAIREKSEDIHLTKLEENIRYIPLETKENNFLRSIYKLQMCDAYIYVSDRRAVYQFNHDGKFIRQVGRPGKGPGEHSKRISFTLNHALNEVLIFSSGTNQLNFYDIDSGEFKHSKDLGFDSYTIEMISDKHLALLTFELRFGYSYSTLVEVYIADAMGDIVDSIMNFDRKNYIGNSAGLPIHYSYNNTINYIYNYRDTVYQILGDLSKRPLLHLGFNNALRGDELDIQPDPNEIQFPDHLMVHKILENEKYLLISIYAGIDMSFSGNNIHRLIYNKSTAKVSHVKKFTNDWDNGPDFWPQWNVNGKLISYYQAHEFLDHFSNIEEKHEFKNHIKDLLDGLNEHDNPVLVIVD